VTDRQVQAAVAHSFLRALPERLVETLLAAGQCVNVPAGTTIYRPGDDLRGFVVVHGLLRVYMSSPEWRQVTLRYAREGDVLGIPVLVGEPVYVSVSMLADSRLFRIDPRILISTAQRDATVASALAEEVNRRLCENLRQTAVIAFGTVRQRVAVHLLYLAAGPARRGVRLPGRFRECPAVELRNRGDPQGHGRFGEGGHAVPPGAYRPQS
jgi:CRP/FNR family transcriptional regulator, cyclic AMP receptor protein